MKRVLTSCSLVILVIVVLCLVGAGVLAIYNQRLLATTAPASFLSDLDIARLEEAIQLRRTFGERIWPGYEDSVIPLIVWNSQHAYLTGHPSPPEGWHEQPEVMVAGQPVYRHDAFEAQNFAMNIGEVWTAVMATKQQTDQFLIDLFHTQLPAIIRDVFPYFLLIQPSEVQISAVLHEAFHVYQAQNAPGKLEQAESAYQFEASYWQADASMHQAWSEEINLLAEALQAETGEESARLGRQFLEKRRLRRQEFNLSPELVSLERLLEWEEGLAKYVELASWQIASQGKADTPAYRPVAGLQNDPDFKQYKTFSRRWSQEISQMKRQADREGVTRFYYTGMAQAFILDRLMPGWKSEAFAEDIALEDLLEKALSQPQP